MIDVIETMSRVVLTVNKHGLKVKHPRRVKIRSHLAALCFRLGCLLAGIQYAEDDTPEQGRRIRCTSCVD